MLTKKTKRHPFPPKGVLTIIEDWPFVKLAFRVPPDKLSMSPIKWKGLTTVMADAIRRILAVEGRYLGFIVLPQYAKKENVYSLAAYISKVWFRVGETPLAQKWCKLSEPRKVDLLAAFYRAPELKIRDHHKESLNAFWCKTLKIAEGDETKCSSLVSTISDPISIRKCHENFKEALNAWASQQMKTVQFQGSSDGIKVLLGDSPPIPAKDYLAVGRVLHSQFSPRNPKRQGFFSNRDQAFSFIVSKTIEQELNPNRLRKHSHKTFSRLCKNLKVDRTDFPEK